MTHDEILVSSDQMPEEARQYMAAIQAHQRHPFVQRHFFQVTWLSLLVPNHGPVEFFALEFHNGLNAALIWQDGQGNWGAGPWLRLAHAVVYWFAIPYVRTLVFTLSFVAVVGIFWEVVK